MNPINFPRLLKLAKHLESNKLGHKKFDFGRWTDGYNRCGTAGCAIGECPIVFPKDWKFGVGEVFLISQETQLDKVNAWDYERALQGAKKFFGITKGQFNHLFVPSEGWEITQRTNKYGGDVLYPNATPSKVAANIRTFVKIMRKKNFEKKVK
jgi:hypothetical protein